MENLKRLLENSLYKKDMISFEKALNKIKYQINQEEFKITEFEKYVVIESK